MIKQHQQMTWSVIVINQKSTSLSERQAFVNVALSRILKKISIEDQQIVCK